MSAPSLLPIFRSEMQVRLMGLLLLQPERSWELSELAGLTGAPVSSVHREITRAVQAGLAIRDDRARPHRYEANTASPAYRPLRELLDQTIGIPDRLRRALQPYPQVVAAAIHGSWAAGRPGRDSDIDVLVIADDAAPQIRRALRRAGREVGREIDVSVLPRSDLTDMAARDNPFVARVLRGPRAELVGDLNAVANR